MNIKLPQLVFDHPHATPVMPERMMWTTSATKQWRACKRKFFWKYVYGLRTHSKGAPLMIGSAFHEAVEEWYRHQRRNMRAIAKKHFTRLERAAEEQMGMREQKQQDKLLADLFAVRGMLEGYGEVYREDRLQWKYTQKMIEAQFVIDCGDYDFAGKIDMIRNLTPKTHQIIEHKTASTITSNYIERLPLDTQIRAYIWGAQSLGMNPKSVLYDVVRKCKLRGKANESITEFTQRIRNDYIERKDFYFYREELRFSQGDIEALRFEVEQCHREFTDALRHGEFDDPRTYLPNDGACTLYNSTCEYMMLCTVGLDLGTAAAYYQELKQHEELDVAGK